MKYADSLTPLLTLPLIVLYYVYFALEFGY